MILRYHKDLYMDISLRACSNAAFALLTPRIVKIFDKRPPPATSPKAPIARALSVFSKGDIPAVANNPAKSVTYLPAGAEHNTFIYQTIAAYASEAPVVINELMASNSTTQTDNTGEYDDWIELYNRSSQPVDISGWYLTDKQNNLDKWQFPQGTVIWPGE